MAGNRVAARRASELNRGTAAEQGVGRTERHAMTYDLWRTDAEMSWSLLYRGDDANTSRLPSDARIVWTCEADTYEEALQKRNDFLGWGPYKRADFPFDYPGKP